MLLSKEMLGVDKLIKSESNECEVYVAEKGRNTFLIVLFDGDHAKYFKVTPTFPGKWDCENILYFLFGYFGFVKDENELIPKLSQKIKELERNVIGTI
jgi:hypothetical protein